MISVPAKVSGVLLFFFMFILSSHYDSLPQWNFHRSMLAVNDDQHGFQVAMPPGNIRNMGGV